MLLSVECRLKAHQLLDQVLEQLDGRLHERQREDQMEAGLFADLLPLGLLMLQGAVDAVVQAALAKAPDSVTREDGSQLVRVNRPDRRLVTVFGELHVGGPVYALRAKQKIEHAPVDQQLALPAHEFSYLVENWSQRMVVKDAFQEAAVSLQELLGLKISVRALEDMNRRVAEHVEAFREHQAPPPAENEGEILVTSTDATGTPMRDRGGSMQMAYLGAAYSIARFVRTPDEILNEVLRQECALKRPRPQSKRLYGDMTRPSPDEPGVSWDGRVGVFSWLAGEVESRNRDGLKPVVCLMDGEAKLWERKEQLLGPKVIEILDLWHVIEKLRTAGAALFGEKTTANEEFVSTRLRQLLEGEVGRVIGGLKQMMTKRKLRGSSGEAFHAAITYFANNQQRMKYDAYLREGYPIASGVIEGACRHVVGDRLDRTGMRWTLAGALAMLATRTTYLSDDWTEYHSARIAREQSRLHPTAHSP
jgi:hypothetical protein